MTSTDGEKGTRQRGTRWHRGAAAKRTARQAAAEDRRARHVAALPDPAATEGPNAEDRIICFPHLDVAILDDMVYTTTGGLLLLGPLAAAAVASKCLPPRAGQAAGAQQTAIAVVSGQSSHRLVVEHTSAPWTPRQIEKQVAEFNFLVSRAKSSPRGDAVDGLPEQVGVTVVA